MAAEFIAELPAGYDQDTALVLMPDNEVLALHPMQPPLRLLKDGTWLELPPKIVHPAHCSSTC